MSLFSRWLRRTGPCRCGHTATAHSHYRAGSECALCACTRMRPTRASKATVCDCTGCHTDQDAVDAEFAAITEQWIDRHFATNDPLDEEH